MNDDDYEYLFGAPEVAAADLHELRAWCHNRTMLTPTRGSQVAREICVKVDPTWPARALTNERVMLPVGSRLLGKGIKVRLAESTIESMMSVADGRNPPTVTSRSARNLEPLWPAQSSSWSTWVMHAMDLNKIDDREMRHHYEPLALPYVHPAVFMMAVRDAKTPYLTAVGEAMDMPRSLWKFGTIAMEFEDFWLRGLTGFAREWLDLFPRGELAMWLRSVVCNGWMTSHQLATYMGLDSARSCAESWI